MTSALRQGSLNSLSNSLIRFSAYSFEKTWQSSSLESMNWQLRLCLLTAVQWRGLNLRRLWRRLLLRDLLMRKPTSCISSRLSSILKVRLRSYQRVTQECYWSAKVITLRSQSPPKGCLWGLMKESESCLQSQFMRSAVKACQPSTLLRLWRPHCSEKRSCFQKKSSFSSIILIADKTDCSKPQPQTAATVPTAFHQSRQCLWVGAGVFVSVIVICRKEDDSHEHSVLPTQFLPLLLGDYLHRGLVEGQRAWHIGRVLVLDATPPALGLVFIALLAHADDFLDLRVPAQVGVVDYLGKVALQAYPALLDEVGIVIGLGPEVRFGEGRKFGLSGARGTSNLSRESCTCLSSLKRYLQMYTSLLVRSLRCISQRTTASSMQQVGILRMQNLSERLKSQSPSTSFFPPIININYIKPSRPLSSHHCPSPPSRPLPSHINMYSLRQYIINMIGLLSMLLFLHSAVSTQRWRTFVQVNQEPFFLPIDISLEIILATILAVAAILANTKKFKVLKQFTQSVSYDASFSKPNFKNYRTSRAALLLPFLKERLSSEDLSLQLRL